MNGIQHVSIEYACSMNQYIEIVDGGVSFPFRCFLDPEDTQLFPCASVMISRMYGVCAAHGDIPK